MQAIITKWHAPTNYRAARVSAQCSARRIIVQWDHAYGVEGNHDEAALALAKALGWSGEWVKGQRPDGSGNAYVCLANNKPAFGVL